MRMVGESSGRREEGADQSTLFAGGDLKAENGCSEQHSETISTTVVSVNEEPQQQSPEGDEQNDDGKDPTIGNSTDCSDGQVAESSPESVVCNGSVSDDKATSNAHEESASEGAHDTTIIDSSEEAKQQVDHSTSDEAEPPLAKSSWGDFFKRRRGKTSCSEESGAESDSAEDVLKDDNNDENSGRQADDGPTLSVALATSEAQEIGETRGISTAEKVQKSNVAEKDSTDESQPSSSSSQPSFRSQESIIASQSMALNDAFMALETMRKANLDLELASMGKVDHRCCTACLRAQWRKEEARAAVGEKRRTWKHNFARRRAALPCLVCASPVCINHSCPEFRKDKVTICGECSPLFGVDFIFDIVFNEDKEHRRACIDKVVDSYDRAVLIIKYSSQFINDIAKALRDNTTRDNSVALGSSGIGLMSGITGAAAAAVHIAAAAAAGAAILSPAGPPLFIASLIFGGTAAAASTSSEAVSYYSEPNQMANRIMALHELINSLLQVTVVLKDALINGRINLNHYVDRKHKKKKKQRKLSNADSQATDSEADEDLEKSASDQDHDTTPRVEEEADDVSTSTAQTDIIDSGAEDPELDEIPKKKDHFSDQLHAAASRLSLDESEKTTKLDTYTSTEVESEEGDDRAEAEEGSDADEVQTAQDINSKNEDESSGDKDAKISTKEAPLKSVSSKSGKKPSTAARHETKVVVSQQDNVRSAICRATTNAMKAASAASAACGVLSVTTIILEAKNMTDSLERMKANKCEKADIIEAIKEEVDKLPATSMIAGECESYLKGSADQAQPAALSMRNRRESQERGAPRVGLPIKLA